ncbi:MAG TPA: hybrid sensor histidine kinase/response regulator [Polyangia bacterium]|nr:hybrid sensor histidine kinase/response regulator [Polyangia bacterium]
MAERTILLVEDEQPLLEVFAEAITEMGHRVVCASRGDDGLAKARAEKPDLILADHMLPGRTGLELLRELRTEDGLGRVPVILMSAGRPRGWEEAWRFVPKPVALGDLEAAVRDGLSAGGSPDSRGPGRPINVAPLVLAREEMLNWVAHEIRSPLAVALMSIDMLKGRLEDRAPEALPRLQVARRNLVRMNDIVASILDAACLEEGRIELRPAPVAIVPFVSNVVREWREGHPEANLVAELADAPAVVRMDQPRVRQILDNLFTNALKYAGVERPIVVSLEHRPSAVAIRLRDHGPGIPREELRHIFDRFVRADDTPGRGHGLGLYIAAALARLHAGSLEADAADGGGTVFSLTLPTADAEHFSAPPRDEFQTNVG